MISPKRTATGSTINLKLLGLLSFSIALVVIYFSLNPAYPLKQSIENTPYGDPLIHLFSFGLLMYCFCLPWKQTRIRIFLGVCFVLLGVGLEMLQTVGGSLFEFGDATANTVGVVVGFVLVHLRKNDDQEEFS